jgi:serine phosphatase RsbU (regulator of sigma subunit)/HAMP domain-containing protein
MTQAPPSASSTPSRPSRISNVLVRGLFGILAIAAFALAGWRFYSLDTFHNPIADAAHGTFFYIAEKENNTILQLRIDVPGEPLRLEGSYSIEPDDQQHYYMVRKLYEGLHGLVVQSYIYDKESNRFVGYRFREYTSWNEPPKDLLQLNLSSQHSFPEVRYAYGPKGEHYFVHDCAGLPCLWRVEPSGQALINDGVLPPQVRSLGETNTTFSSWNGIEVGPDGRIYLTSGASGRVVEYSPEGQRLREFGKVGFDEGALLAPAEITFCMLGPRAPRLLTVASPGNRTWVQYDEDGQFVRALSPLKSGYQFSDISIGPLHMVGPHRVPCAFDLANKALVMLNRDFTAIHTYIAPQHLHSGLLMMIGFILTAMVIFYNRLRHFLRHLKFPFFFKLLLLFVPLLVASAMIVRDKVKDEITDDLLLEYIHRSENLARAIANTISVEDLERIQAPEDRESPTYERIYLAVDRLVDTRHVEETPKWILHKIHEGRFYFGINIWRGPIYEPFIVPRDRPMFLNVLRDKTPQHGIFTDDQGEWFSYLFPITNTTSDVIYVIELYRTTESLNRTDRAISQRVGNIIGVTIAATAVLLLAFSFAFTRPLRLLVRATKRVSAGHFDQRIHIHSRDEVGMLSHAFNRMLGELKKYTADLARTTADKERFEAELRFAHTVQQELLPKVFPPYPGAKQVEIFARMEPAREVGGDYYDFFPISSDHVAALVADVSGKGVGAGLFMMRVRTLLRDNAQRNLSAADTLKRVNQLIVPDNPSFMFVTMLYLICDMRTGQITLCNAGHPSPLLIRQGETQELPVPSEGHHAPLGIKEHVNYQDISLNLQAGDSLLFFTDGVTEAIDQKEIMYGEQRLFEIVKQNASGPLHEICDRIITDVNRHQQGLEQFDDITLLLFKYLGRE